MCVVFTLNRSFYPTTSVHPASVLILHPREIQIMWSQTVRQRKNKTAINQGKASGHRLRPRKTKTTAINRGKASETLAYLVREHDKTSQTRKRRKRRNKKTKTLTGVLKNVIQDRKARKNSIHTCCGRVNGAQRYFLFVYEGSTTEPPSHAD